VAENSGGAHCLKYGFTTTHVLGMDVVLPSGELVIFGSAAPDAPGYDLTGVFVGSEGTLGVTTKIVLRIVKRPETVQVLLAAFESVVAAAQAVSDIIAAGMLPAALEMMDRLSARAAEAAVHPNYPVCEALLLVELDGPEAEVAAQMLAGAGTPWAAMQRALAVHNQQVALDPLWPETATVGGIVATNDSGSLRLRYGSLRDLILGMTIVLADGTIAKSGGKVVKNVAGYDLHKLMTGAFGTLGAIAEVTFRLHPISQHAVSFTVSTSEVARLKPLMLAIGASHLLTEGLQLRGTSYGMHLDIQLSAHSDSEQAELLRHITEGESLELELNSNEIWQAREALLTQTDRLILKATMLPTEVPAFAQEVAEKGGEFVVESLGIMYAAFPTDELSFKLAEEFRHHVGLQGGTTVWLARPLSASYSEMWAFVAKGELPETHALMREIKRRFDPNRILNPGRFVGGI